MLATGEALENYAEGQANRELTALLGRAPQDVRRYDGVGAPVVPRSPRSWPMTACWRCGPARSCRWMATVLVERRDPARRVRPDRRGATGHARGGRRCRERRQSMAAGHSTCAPRPPRTPARMPASCVSSSRRSHSQGPLRAYRGSLRPSCSYRSRLAVPQGVAWLVSRAPHACSRGARGGDPLSPAPCGTHRHRWSGISRAARRGIIVKGGGAARDPGALASAPVRQDRHPDRGPAQASLAPPLSNRGSRGFLQGETLRHGGGARAGGPRTCWPGAHRACCSGARTWS